MSDPSKPSPYASWGAGSSRWSGAPSAPPEAQRLQQLYQAAAADLYRGRTEVARPAVQELAQALPALQPAAREHIQYMQRCLAVIGFECPAERAPVALSRRAPPPRQEDVDLVAFHVELAQAPSGIHERIDYMEVLGHSFESARIRAPAARRLLITDERTAVPDTLPVHAVLRYAIDARELMFERMRVQEAFLRGRDAARATILMDSDVVVNADPAAIFGEDFDVGLTWRPEFADAPFNGGMIFAAPGPGAHAFFVRALDCYRAMAADPQVAAAFPKDLKAWWGDQFALAARVGYRAYAERNGAALSVDGVRVAFFPCDTYNFTFDGGSYDPDVLRRKYFLHFKGNRKSMQAQYLELMRSGKV